jgi:hypothetical protein
MILHGLLVLLKLYGSTDTQLDVGDLSDYPEVEDL